MSTSRKVWICTVLLSLPMLAGQGIIQPFPAQAAPEAESLIRLHVVVNDKSGKPVSGLEQKDFTVVDNKQPEKILSFEAVTDATADSEPVEVVLVVDSVNISFTRVAYVRNQIKKFLQKDGGKLARPVSITFLSDSGLNAQGTSSRDANALAGYLDQNPSSLRTITRSQGFYGADDRTQISINGFEQLTAYAAQRPGRKIVICVSPGWPLLSGPNAEEGLTPKNKEAIFSTIVSLSTQLRQAGVTLYNVDPLGPTENEGREFYYESFLNTAVQNRHKSSDPCCKRGLYVPGTGVLRLRSAAVSLRLLSKSPTVRGRTGWMLQSLCGGQEANPIAPSFPTLVRRYPQQPVLISSVPG